MPESTPEVQGGPDDCASLKQIYLNLSRSTWQLSQIRGSLRSSDARHLSIAITDVETAMMQIREVIDPFRD